MSTAEQIAVMTSVMHAFAEERKIEYISKFPDHKPNHWLPCNAPAWDWQNFDYRVAEERPREWAIAFCKHADRMEMAANLGLDPGAQNSDWEAVRVTELPDGWEVRRKPVYEYCRVISSDTSVLWRRDAAGKVAYREHGKDYWEPSCVDWRGLLLECTETDAAGRPVEKP